MVQKHKNPRIERMFTPILVNLVAPIFGGKGLHSKKLKGRLHSKGIESTIISSGELVKKKLDEDPVFRSEFGEVVRNRGRIPNLIICDMILDAIRAAHTPILITDGCLRDPQQAIVYNKAGYLTPKNSVTFFLDAHRTSCERRYRIAMQSGERADRTDNDAFNEGFELFQRTIASIRRTTKPLTNWHKIDGDKDPEEIGSKIWVKLMDFVDNTHQGIVSDTAPCQSEEIFHRGPSPSALAAASA